MDVSAIEVKYYYLLLLLSQFKFPLEVIAHATLDAITNQLRLLNWLYFRTLFYLSYDFQGRIP